MFDKAFELVIEVEGGYVDHPNDKGGATNYGITQAVLSEFRKTKVTKDDVKNLSKEEAKKIYKSRYWDALNLDSFSHKTLALLLFDQGVNRGVGAAAKSIQKVAGCSIDGKIGPNTIKEIHKKPEIKLCFDFIKDAQFTYINICKRDNTQLVFLQGWISRTHKLLDLVSESINT